MTPLTDAAGARRLSASGRRSRGRPHRWPRTPSSSAARSCRGGPTDAGRPGSDLRCRQLRRPARGGPGRWWGGRVRTSENLTAPELPARRRRAPGPAPARWAGARREPERPRRYASTRPGRQPPRAATSTGRSAGPHGDRRPRREVGADGAGEVDLHLRAVRQGDRDPRAGAGERAGDHPAGAGRVDLDEQRLGADERDDRRRTRGAGPATGRRVPSSSHLARRAGSPAPGSSCRRTRRRTPSPGARRARRGWPPAPAGRPAARPTRSATDSASAWSWVTKTVVMPSSSWIRRISSRSCTRTWASSAESGSSSSSTWGATASARASATRCCWPPESWCG